MITSSDVVSAFPELSAVTSGTWTFAIAQAYDDLDATEFGDDLDRVALLLAAHYGRLSTANLARGLVQSETVGPVSRTYAIPTGLGADDLGLTPYGMMAKRAIRSRVSRWVVG